MRASSILLALPALAVAQDQNPLGDLFNKIKGAVKAASTYIPSSIPSVIPDPVDAGAAKVAEQVVHKLDLANWKATVAPSASAKSTGPEPWFVYITGGNKTCYGQCALADSAFNKAAALLAASPSGPQLATVDCEAEPILCNSWIASPPSVYYFLIPQPLADQTTPATTVHYIPLNSSSVEVSELVELHTKDKYLETPPYEGYFHPFDSPLAKTGANVPLAWAMWGLAKLPSWAPMVIISFVSRSFMGRRMPQGGQGAGAAAPAPAAR